MVGNSVYQGEFMTTHTLSLSLVLASALFAAGCSSTDTPAPPPAADPALGCTSAAVSHLKGQMATPALLEQARLQAAASSARILTPSSVVTLEYNSQRLNLNVDDQGLITRVTCG
jgi:hypothetical protein